MNTTKNQVGARAYLTAGIAALGAGAVALSPVQPVTGYAAPVQHRIVADPGNLLLASSFDPITPWVDTITNSIDNIGALIGFAFEKPFPILQTVIANIGTYFGELTSGNAGLIPGQIFGNIQKLFTAPFNPGEISSFSYGPPPGTETSFPAGTYLGNTLMPDGGPAAATQSLVNALIVDKLILNPTPECADAGDCGIWPSLGPLTIPLNSYGSGALVGLLSPILSPVAALINSATAIVDAIKASDFIGAINELVNIPANLVNGFLNGALLNLTPILNLIAEPGSLPIEEVGLRLGGLIAGPTPINGSLVPNAPIGPPTKFSGGTAFDAAYLVVTDPTDYVQPGLPIGPIGSLIGMGQYLSDQLVVTPPAAPAAQTAAATEVEAPAAAGDSAEAAVAAAEESAPADLDAVEAAAAPVTAAPAEAAAQTEADTTAPTRAGARASRGGAPAAAGADTATRSGPRAAAASRR